MAVLEDFYLPYRPKRRTRATMAREKGLEPLAQFLLRTDECRGDPRRHGRALCECENGVDSVEDALAGARDIVARDHQRGRADAHALARVF